MSLKLFTRILDGPHALRQWLPNIIQSVEPWMSAEDIEAGARWGKDISDQLEQTRFGIICVTPENQHAPWILFEAGALAKTIENTYVCPYLIGLSLSQLQGGPLTQFQAKQANEPQTWELLHTINRALGDSALSEERLRTTFDKWWSELEQTLENIPEPENGQELKRSSEDMLAEVLEVVRGISRLTNEGAREAQQLRLQEANVKYMLYERRLEILNGVMDFVATVNTSENVEIEMISKFNRETAECIFIFGKDIQEYIHDLRSKAHKLHSEKIKYSHRLKDRPDNDIERLSCESNMDELYIWFISQDYEALEKFKPHLTIPTNSTGRTVMERAREDRKNDKPLDELIRHTIIDLSKDHNEVTIDMVVKEIENIKFRDLRSPQIISTIQGMYQLGIVTWDTKGHHASSGSVIEINPEYLPEQN